MNDILMWVTWLTAGLAFGALFGMLFRRARRRSDLIAWMDDNASQEEYIAVFHAVWNKKKLTPEERLLVLKLSDRAPFHIRMQILSTLPDERGN